MPGRLPFNHTIVGDGTNYLFLAWLKAERTYEIEEASIAPDATAVTAGTWYGGIFISPGGSDFAPGTSTPGGEFGTFVSATKRYNPQIGGRLDGLLQDIIDPGTRAVNPDNDVSPGFLLSPLLTNIGQSNAWRLAGKRPILERERFLVLMAYTFDNTKTGNIVFQVNGYPHDT